MHAKYVLYCTILNQATCAKGGLQFHALQAGHLRRLGSRNLFPHLFRTEQRQARPLRWYRGANYPIQRTRSRLNRLIIGARRVIASYIGLINFFTEKTAWGDGVDKFQKDEVFALEPKAATSDSYLHGRAPGCWPVVPQVAGMGSEEDYGTGLHCKPAYLRDRHVCEGGPRVETTS